MQRLAAVVTLVVALVLAFTWDASAQLNLSWNNCYGQPGAASTMQYACQGGDATPRKLVLSFIPPAQYERFISAYVIVAIYTENQDLPDYWRMGYGECRDGHMAATTDLTGIGTGSTGACQNPWLGTTVTAFNEYKSGPWDAFDPPMTALYQANIGRAEGTSITLNAGQEYIAAVIALDPGQAESCGGCSMPVTLTFRELILFDETGTATPVDLTAPASNSTVYWQGNYTPAKHKTWGAIKAAYR